MSWGEGSQYCGKLPSVRTLAEIKERIQMEQSVRERLKVKGLMDARGHDGHHSQKGKVQGARDAKELGSMIDGTMKAMMVAAIRKKVLFIIINVKNYCTRPNFFSSSR